jgi:hypothetical protein
MWRANHTMRLAPASANTRRVRPPSDDVGIYPTGQFAPARAHLSLKPRLCRLSPRGSVRQRRVSSATTCLRFQRRYWCRIQQNPNNSKTVFARGQPPRCFQRLKPQPQLGKLGSESELAHTAWRADPQAVKEVATTMSPLQPARWRTRWRRWGWWGHTKCYREFVIGPYSCHWFPL